MFFPNRGQSQRPGKAICGGCPVTEECADYAQRSHSDYGMWAGQMRRRGPTLSS